MSNCTVCHTEGILKKCSGCSTPYCCADCQRKDWGNHQRRCIGHQIKKTEAIRLPKKYLTRMRLPTVADLENGCKILNIASETHKVQFKQKKRKLSFTKHTYAELRLEDLLDRLLEEEGEIVVDCGLWCQLALLPPDTVGFTLQNPYLFPYASEECYYIFPSGEAALNLEKHWTTKKGEWVIPVPAISGVPPLYLGLGVNVAVQTLASWARELRMGISKDVGKYPAPEHMKTITAIKDALSAGELCDWTVGTVKNGKHFLSDNITLHGV